MTENTTRLDPIAANDELLAAIPGAVTAALENAAMELLAKLSPCDMPGLRRELPAALIAVIKLAVEQIESGSDDAMSLASAPAPGKANRAFAQYAADELLPKALLTACMRSDRKTYNAAVESWHPEIDMGEYRQRK